MDKLSTNCPTYVPMRTSEVRMAYMRDWWEKDGIKGRLVITLFELKTRPGHF